MSGAGAVLLANAMSAMAAAGSQCLGASMVRELYERAAEVAA